MITTNKEYLDLLSDVSIKFKAYKTYKTKEGALKILLKKTKHLSITSQEQDLDISYEIYNKAAALIDSGDYIDRSGNTTGFTSFDDILTDKCMSALKIYFPGVNEQFILSVLNWIIQWHYLR